MDQGCEAVGGAARVGNDVMLGRIIESVIHADDEGGVLALGRCGNDDFLTTGSDVALGLRCIGKEAGGLDDDFHAQLFPRQTVWTASADHFDFVTIDDDDVVLFQRWGRFLGGHRACEATLGGVVFQKVSKIVRRNDIPDGDDIEGSSEVALFDEGTENEAADAAESVDGDGGHDSN